MQWNRKSVSVICRVTWFIIHPSIWNEFDIVCINLWAFFLQILHAISNVQLCCYIFSTKKFSKLVLSFGEVVWPFDNFFVSFLCLRLFNISSICLWDVFDLVKRKARDFFATAFHCCLLISHSLFCNVSHRWSFYPHHRHEQSHSVYLKVLQVSGFLLPLSLLKYFLSRANLSLRVTIISTRI